MIQEVIMYRCTKCGYMTSTKIAICPACNSACSQERYAYPNTTPKQGIITRG